MLLKGSCHCGAVKFKLRSHTPYPYNRCYCAICRKTAGGGGFAVNIMGDADTLEVEGRRHITVYRARVTRGRRTVPSPSHRHFCKRCGAALWLWDKDWPQWVYPLASAIDSKLPVPPRRTHLMLGSKAPWVEAHIKRGDKQFSDYPDEGIADWHERMELWVK